MNKEIEFYKSEYTRRRLSRREFAGRMAAIGVSAAAAGAILTSADKVLADTPVMGGRMRIGWYTHAAADTLKIFTLIALQHQCHALVEFGQLHLAAHTNLEITFLQLIIAIAKTQADLGGGCLEVSRISAVKIIHPLHQLVGAVSHIVMALIRPATLGLPVLGRRFALLALFC